MHADFEGLLKQAMGLDAASIGSPAIARAVQDRLTACRLKNVEAYWEVVRNSQTELQELIEAVVVPETWFFRDREAFVALVRMVQEQWLANQEMMQLRLLSVPCSTGEEPYSMAMALLDGGLAPERFSVQAVDISERALAQARRAVYGRNSFRGNQLDFRERHFESTAQGQRLREVVHERVTFQQGNLFDAAFLPGAAHYHVIFCRNVLIYFDRPTQDRAVAVLGRLLMDDGMLFVAPSETGLLLSHGFVSTKVPLAFAFRKASPAVIVRDSEPEVRVPRATPLRPPAPMPARSRPAKASAVVASGSALGIDEAIRLADQGRLEEAGQACAAYLRQHAPTAAALYLMGLVDDASGRLAQAAAWYRKALYLDPNHHEALLHLALLLERGGDARGAQVLRVRARRLEGTGGVRA